MSEKLKDGICTCGCIDQQVRKTANGDVFFLQSGLGYVRRDLSDAEFGFTIWEEYFEDTEVFAGKVPVTYAINKSWAHATFKDENAPTEVFHNVIRNMKKVFVGV